VTDQTPAQTLLEATCDRERVAIIFNPASGGGDSEIRRSGLEELARSAGLSCELQETELDHGAGPLAAQAVADCMERVIVSGGDGSLREAAHALAGTAISLAVVPGGTGNLLAMNLGIPTDREEAMCLALSGEAKPMDVGRANGKVFLVAAGMGLDAQLIGDADRELKDGFGKLAYAIALVRNLGRRHIRYTVTIDGVRRRRHGQMVLIANLGRITGGLELVRGSDPDDGLLEVAILRTRRLRDFALIALRAILSRPGDQTLLELHQGRHIVVETRRPQPMQIDGDEVGPTTRLEVTVEPGALLLVRPDAPVDPTPLEVLAPTAGGRPRLPLAVGAGLLSMAALWIAQRRLSEGRTGGSRSDDRDT
jgi:diacylglycerol kinase (ATP)